MSVNRWIVVAGLLLVVVGLLWPWLSRLPIGRLPGDIAIERNGFRLYVPLATCLVVSIVLTILLWLIRR
jgi:hypothetical protein